MISSVSSYPCLEVLIPFEPSCATLVFGCLFGWLVVLMVGLCVRQLVCYKFLKRHGNYTSMLLSEHLLI